MMWISYIKGFEAYLKLEKSLSQNSIEAYIGDVEKLTQYLEYIKTEISPDKIEPKHLHDFIKWINQLGMSAASQARVISGIRGFYKYLILENIIKNNPTELLDSPKIGRKLPDVLSIEEIDQLLAAIDLSKSGGERNKAIIETIYGCGLRVSELINLKISNISFTTGFIKIVGKGNKERMVPIGNSALKQIKIYSNNVRVHLDIKKGHEDFLFLNRNGRKLTRVMIFTIIKDLTKKIGLKKNIHPHTFRHSFATHLIDGGADLRAVQEMLGHESITTTEIYTHLDREYLRDTIIRFHPRSNRK